MLLVNLLRVVYSCVHFRRVNLAVLNPCSLAQQKPTINSFIQQKLCHEMRCKSCNVLLLNISMFSRFEINSTGTEFNGFDIQLCRENTCYSYAPLNSCKNHLFHLESMSSLPLND